MFQDSDMGESGLRLEHAGRVPRWERGEVRLWLESRIKIRLQNIWVGSIIILLLIFKKEGNVYDEGENRIPGVDIKAGGRALYNLTWNS